MLHRQKKKTVLHHSWPEHPLRDRWKMAEVKAEQYSTTTCCRKFCWAAHLFTFTRLTIPWAFSYSLCFCHILFLAARSLLAILFQNGSSFQWLLGCHHIAGVLTDLNLLLKKRYCHHHHWQSWGEQPMDLQTLHWFHSSTAACPERGQVSQRSWPHVLLSHTLWNCSL